MFDSVGFDIFPPELGRRFRLSRGAMAVMTWMILANTFGRGVAIAVAGMLIVSVALSVIALFIAALPRILEWAGKYLPEVEEPHAGRSHPESLVPDDDKVLAAIGFVLHSEFQRQLANERQHTKS